jgi:hypothetical protein
MIFPFVLWSQKRNRKEKMLDGSNKLNYNTLSTSPSRFHVSNPPDRTGKKSKSDLLFPVIVLGNVKPPGNAVPF